MIINIGSKNEVKVNAVKEIIKDYNLFSNSEIISMDVSSDISDQPKNLNETIQGAINRAKNSFNNCNYSFGIESGLMKVENSKSGYMDICVCAIFDGKNIHLGLSSAFEYPKKVMALILKEGLDGSQAFFKSGITNKTKLGSEEGAIGLLTKGRLMRKEFTKQAITTALIHLENPDLF